MNKLLSFVFLLLFFFVSFTYAENTSDNIREYLMRKPFFELKPFVLNMAESQRKKLFNNRNPYNITLGNGQTVRLSFLAENMQSNELAKNLRWGEQYTTFAAVLGVSIGLTSLGGILGSSFLLTYYNNISSNLVPNSINQNFLILGLTSLGVSTFSLISLITFSILLYKSSKYHLTESHIKSILKQYDTYLRKKLKIPLDLDVSIDFSQNLKFLFSYRL